MKSAIFIVSMIIILSGGNIIQALCTIDSCVIKFRATSCAKSNCFDFFETIISYSFIESNITKYSKTYVAIQPLYSFCEKKFTECYYYNGDIQNSLSLYNIEKTNNLIGITLLFVLVVAFIFIVIVLKIKFPKIF